MVLMGNLAQLVPQVLLDLLVPGVYYFSYSIHVNGAHALVALYKNDHPVMFTYDEYNKGFVDQMSGSAVLLLDEHDTVYVQIPDDEANGVFAAENVHCSFSGFLIAST
uniref:Collagen, type X, alpha 1 n=1 Tax=Nothobranchius kuhntae TaxID=321403 RepID=A0A1A8IW74_NOTKU